MSQNVVLIYSKFYKFKNTLHLVEATYYYTSVHNRPIFVFFYLEPTIISGEETFFLVSLQYFIPYNLIDIFLDPFTSIYYPALNVVCKSITVEENSTSIRPLAAKNVVPIFLLLEEIFGFLGAQFLMPSTVCLFFVPK